MTYKIFPPKEKELPIEYNNLLNDIFSPPPLIGNPLNIEIEKYRITIKFRELYRYDGKPIEISGIIFERI